MTNYVNMYSNGTLGTAWPSRNLAISASQRVSMITVVKDDIVVVCRFRVHEKPGYRILPMPAGDAYPLMAVRRA